MKRVLVAVVMVALIGSGCGGGGADGPSDGDDSGGSIAHPTGGGEVVVRVTSSGGGPPPPGFLLSLAGVPDFTLYGNGTVLRPGPDAGHLSRSSLTENGTQIILAEAAELGLLEESRCFGCGEVADTSSFSLFFDAAGARSSVTVLDGTITDAEAAEPIAAYRERFFDLQGWLGDELQPFETVAAERVRVVVPDVWEPFTFGEPEYRDWVLADLADPAMYEGTHAGEPCFVLSGEELTRALPELEAATEDTLWNHAGDVYQVVFRPLLPDEEGCRPATVTLRRGDGDDGGQFSGVGGADFCERLSALPAEAGGMAELGPVADPEQFADLSSSLGSSLAAATASAPDEIGTDVEVAASTLTRVVDAYLAAGGDWNFVAASDLEPLYGGEYLAAAGRVDAYLVEVCGFLVPATAGPVGADRFGDHALFDALWVGCEEGDMAACDTLFYLSPVSSDYERFGSTCGERYQGGADCVDVLPE